MMRQLQHWFQHAPLPPSLAWVRLLRCQGKEMPASVETIFSSGASCRHEVQTRPYEDRPDEMTTNDGCDAFTTPLGRDVSHRCGVVTQRPSSCSFAGAQLRQLPESSPLSVRADAPPLLAAVRELERSEPRGPRERAGLRVVLRRVPEGARVIAIESHARVVAPAIGRILL
jgi:hypothetical protein